jgi:hypothetical protein
MIGDLVAFLLGNNDIASIVGTRIFPLRVPEGETFPCIVFQQISGPRVYSLSGPNACNYPRIQLKCWGLTYTDAKGLADTVDNLLDGFRGTMVHHADTSYPQRGRRRRRGIPRERERRGPLLCRPGLHHLVPEGLKHVFRIRRAGDSHCVLD